MILNDWQRGKIPYFCLPPLDTSKEKITTEKEAKKESETKINQILKNIPVRSEFKDFKPEEGGDEISENEEEIVDWDQVYAGVTGEENEEEFELHPSETRIENESSNTEEIQLTNNNKKRKNIEQTEKYCESDNDIEKLNKVSKKPEKKGTKS